MNELIIIKHKKHNMIYKTLIIFMMLLAISITYKITYKNTEDSKIEYQIYATKTELFSENTIKYHIKVNYLANTITIYQKNGKELQPIKAMICSCGEVTPTEGTYTTSDKYIWQELFGNKYGRYCTRIVGHILFHSVPYTENNNPGTLLGEEYDKLGQNASAGCIRLKVEDAKWIYENCAKGTEVEFYSDENPGPLGKPEIFQISNHEFSNWDPTDEDINNPWNIYIKSLKENIKKDVKKNQNMTCDIIKQKTTNKIYKNLIIKNINNIEENDYIGIVMNNLKKQYSSI